MNPSPHSRSAPAPHRRPADPHLDPQLDPERIIETIRTLRDRVEERFPGSGLSRVASRLLRIAAKTGEQVEWVSQPHLPLRIAAGVLAALILALPVWLFVRANLAAGVEDFAEFVQVLEAGVNDLIFLGAVVFFLLTAESRIKRRRALEAIRELRAVAHIVDMHQLTKDPDRLVLPGEDTPSSPERPLTPFELARYLDYCSEMLSLNSKLAALYAQNLHDPVVLAAVDEVEALTTGLSGKIWQKIVMISRVEV